MSTLPVNTLSRFSDPNSMIAELKRIKDNPLQLGGPAVKAFSRGLMGPTLLVQHGSPEVTRYVIKWTDANEWETTRKCQLLFSRFFGFPQVVHVDREQHQEINGLLTELLKKIESKQPSNENKIIFFMEYVEGQTLCDFILTRYACESGVGCRLDLELREKMFKRLGRSVMCDLFLGNLDRLYKPEDDVDGKYMIRSFDSNLANIMIRHKDDQFALYMIDNVKDPCLNSDEFSKFVNRIRSKPATLVPEIAEAIIKSMKDGIYNDIENEEDPKIQASRRQSMHLKFFLIDLETIAKKPLEEGLFDGLERLEKEWLPLAKRRENLSPVLHEQRSWLRATERFSSQITRESLESLKILAENAPKGLEELATTIQEALLANQFDSLSKALREEMPNWDLKPNSPEPLLPCVTPFEWEGIDSSLLDDDEISSFGVMIPPDAQKTLASKPPSRVPSPILNLGALSLDEEKE